MKLTKIGLTVFLFVFMISVVAQARDITNVATAQASSYLMKLVTSGMVDHWGTYRAVDTGWEIRQVWVDPAKWHRMSVAAKKNLILKISAADAVIGQPTHIEVYDASAKYYALPVVYFDPPDSWEFHNYGK